MKLQPSFNQVFAQLNAQQKQAVTTIEGPLMVIAGPGTGKTHVLACRIAHILATQDVEPRNILAVTFTDAAAKNMRERIVQMIGPTGYHVAIATFHSFCSEVISENPEYFDIARESLPLSDLERYSFFEEILLQTRLELLRPLGRPLHYLGEVQKAISDLKREGINPDEFETILAAEAKSLEIQWDEYKAAERKKREKNLQKQRELHTIFVKYQALLTQRNRFDFDDMVSMVAHAFVTHEDLLSEYQEKFQYVLVDEYQDTNSSQNAVVDALVSFWGDQANLCVVGDPHQSIFRFQGASVENMLGFLDRYPQATVITLKTGYRCPQVLYDAAHASILNNTFIQAKDAVRAPELNDVLHNALSTKLSSVHGSMDTEGQPSGLQLYEAPNQLLENQFIFQNIQELLEKSVSPAEIAILYKNHVDVTELSEMLQAENIPFITDYSENIFDDIYVQQLLDVMYVIDGLTQVEDSTRFFEVLLLEWLGLPRLAVMQTARIASALRVSFVQLLERDVETVVSEFSLDRDGFVQLQAFKLHLESLRARAVDMQFHAWFELLLSDEGLGLYTWLVTHARKKEHLFSLNSLFSEIKKWVAQSNTFSLSDFLPAVQTMRDHRLVIRAQRLQPSPNKITVCSVHKAKGREWEYVFLVALRDKKWGNGRKKNLLPLPQGILAHVDTTKQEDNEEDRRLFYVALTRAKKQTILSFSTSEIDGKAVRSFVGSMFLSETAAYINRVPEFFHDTLAQRVTERLHVAPLGALAKSSTDEREFFASLVADLKLSVTALNAYLKDPKEFVFNVLLRVPRAKEPHMSYGTAMHAALEKYYLSVDPIAGTSALSLLELQDFFSNSLKKEFLLEEDFILWENRGKQALTAYYQAYSEKLKKPLFTERFFGGTANAVVLLDGKHAIALTGRIDRIDLIDGQKKLVRLVDYKTGKARSQNDIEATTQNALKNLSDRENKLPESIRGSYKRQLVFYVLLAQLDASFSYTIADTVFEFIEPTDSGKIVARHFVITQAEVEDLKALIIEVMREIRNLDFLSLL